jgi:uncharacterized protein (DUF111 family)
VAVPAPATARLLEGHPVRFEGKGELTTPTGAAILVAVTEHFGSPPALVLRATGFGAGTKEFPDRANVLRVTLGQPVESANAVHGDGRPATNISELATNLDDMPPELLPPLIDALMAAGALDAWATPISMKKGRAGFCVQALVETGLCDAVADAFFDNSSTLGVRMVPMSRRVLPREMATVPTAFGEVRVKMAYRGDELFRVVPEFEDCRARAVAVQAPVHRVYEAAQAAAHARLVQNQTGERAVRQARRGDDEGA